MLSDMTMSLSFNYYYYNNYCYAPIPRVREMSKRICPAKYQIFYFTKFGSINQTKVRQNNKIYGSGCDSTCHIFSAAHFP